MTFSRMFGPIAIVSALALVPSTALAQRGGGRSHGGSSGRSSGAVRGGGGGGSVRGGGAVRGGGGRTFGSASRGVGRSFGGSRGGVVVAPRGGGSRVLGSRGFGVVGSRGFSSRGFGVVGSRGFGFGSARFYRPYYSFRPHFSLGFGLWAGYPVSYPYYYDYDYPYAYPSASSVYVYPPYDNYNGYSAPTYSSPGYPQYGSAAPGYSTPQQAPPPAVGVQPGGQQASGGVSFEITPTSAAILVDGTYVGTVADFGPTAAPLGLPPGRHHIEVRAAGYQTMAFEADVTAGQVLPYQGSLQRTR